MNINITFEGITVGAIGTFTLVGGAFYYYIKHQDEVKKFVSDFMFLFRAIWKGKKNIERFFIKIDTEGRFNNFLEKKIIKNVGDFLIKRVKIEWVTEKNLGFTRQDFIQNGELIIQLHKTKDRDENFLNGVLLLVSKCIVPNHRKYLSKNQKKSVDLYSTLKFFDEEKSHIRTAFYDKFVLECQKNPDIAGLVESFIEIDKQGLFFPVLIQELQLLSQKTFLVANPQYLYAEVKKIVDFLVTYAQLRENKMPAPLEFTGRFCKCHIVLVGIPRKMAYQGIKPYVSAIKTCLARGVETVYLISTDDNSTKDFVSQVLLQVQESWLLQRDFSYYVSIECPDGTIRSVKTYLAVLRKKGIEERIHIPEVITMTQQQKNPSGLELKAQKKIAGKTHANYT